MKKKHKNCGIGNAGIRIVDRAESLHSLQIGFVSTKKI